jgi:hypothetical protein
MKGNRRLVFCMSAVAALLFCGCPKAPRDSHGLEHEFEPFLRAYAQGDTNAQSRAYGLLAIPEAGKWFATYFASADVEQLGWDYEAEVDAYEKSLINTMRTLGSAKRFHAHCEPADKARPTSLQPRADAVKPTRDVPVEQFTVEFVSDDGRRFSQLCNFVYLNGAYRYVGKGAYPFWSMPDATRKG